MSKRKTSKGIVTESVIDWTISCWCCGRCYWITGLLCFACISFDPRLVPLRVEYDLISTVSLFQHYRYYNYTTTRSLHPTHYYVGSLSTDLFFHSYLIEHNRTMLTIKRICVIIGEGEIKRGEWRRNKAR
jgi:hypothetical protein